jgi:hypothetical protein
LGSIYNFVIIYFSFGLHGFIKGGQCYSKGWGKMEKLRIRRKEVELFGGKGQKTEKV